MTKMKLALLGAFGLVLSACSTEEPSAPEPINFTSPMAPRQGNADAVAAFEKADAEAMPPKCATLFVGSSTIRFWSSLKQDFPTRTVINRGFGGSTVWEVDAFFDKVVAPYHPKQIVFYAGDNDLAMNPPRTPEQIYDDFLAFMAMKDNALGKTPVWFISVKPSKLRWDMQAQMTELNAKVKALADRRDDLAYIDVVPAMLKPDGTPKDIFREDRLHMTPEGYALWTPVVNKALDAGQKAKAPGC
ncbi:MAG TPA: GDSL-type esterase/lipase family protein [Hyphomonadaceae bacterium]|nr:GDSL-type esterase/lipase family protein [Hyphomonadaceae bacterium]